MFSFTYSYDYDGGLCTRVYAELYVGGRRADVLGSGAMSVAASRTGHTGRSRGKALDTPTACDILK